MKIGVQCIVVGSRDMTGNRVIDFFSLHSCPAASLSEIDFKAMYIVK